LSARRNCTSRQADFQPAAGCPISGLSVAFGSFVAAWLDRAWRQREGGVTGLLYDPFILRYKDDVRMAAFCKKVGLPTPAEVAQNKSKAT
jgi:hypothetical protein